MGYDKIYRKQEFKSVDIIFMFAGGLLVFLMGLNALVGSKQEIQHAKNKYTAESLGYQLLQIYKEKRMSQVRGLKDQPKQSRGLANVDDMNNKGFELQGTIGKNRFGNPFYYQISEINSYQVEILVFDGDRSQHKDKPMPTFSRTFELKQLAADSSYQDI